MWCSHPSVSTSYYEGVNVWLVSMLACRCQPHARLMLRPILIGILFVALLEMVGNRYVVHESLLMHFKWPKTTVAACRL